MGERLGSWDKRLKSSMAPWLGMRNRILLEAGTIDTRGETKGPEAPDPSYAEEEGRGGGDGGWVRMRGTYADGMGSVVCSPIPRGWHTVPSRA